MARLAAAPVLIAHGGAGPRGPVEEFAQRRRGLLEAVREGVALLRGGASALDAVIATVVALENHPLFNAGTGSLLTLEGTIEMDASVMVAQRGAKPTAGAVAGVSRVRNPILLARAVMEQTPHVLLIGAGAERLARRAGIRLCRPDELITSRARERWLARRQATAAAVAQAPARALLAGHGTVGAAALDASGGLAAATSTGGVPGKIAGRVGDSAIIGAGTFASRDGAASATGNGEAIIMAALCRELVESLRRGRGPEAASHSIIEKLIGAAGAEAGVIVIDRAGRAGYAHNAGAMQLAVADSRGVRHLSPDPIGRRA